MKEYTPNQILREQIESWREHAEKIEDRHTNGRMEEVARVYRNVADELEQTIERADSDVVTPEDVADATGRPVESVRGRWDQLLENGGSEKRAGSYNE